MSSRKWKNPYLTVHPDQFNKKFPLTYRYNKLKPALYQSVLLLPTLLRQNFVQGSEIERMNE